MILASRPWLAARRRHNMNAMTLFAIVDGRNDPAIHRARRRAIAGAAPTSTTATLRDEPAPELIRAAACHALELALLTQVVEAHADIVGDPSDPALEPVVHALRNASAAVVRSAWLALQADAARVGYRTGRWNDRAVAVTSDVLRAEVGEFDPPLEPIPSEVARVAGHELALALRATSTDRMAVPGHLACASGLAVALFMLAHELDGR